MFNTKRGPGLTFEQAYTRWAKARNRTGDIAARVPVGNNTELVPVLDTTGTLIEFQVRLHDSTVVVIHQNGNYTVTLAGWNTVTTRRRIRDFSPARCYTEDGTPWIWWPTLGGPDRTEFRGAVTVDPDGVPLGHK